MPHDLTNGDRYVTFKRAADETEWTYSGKMSVNQISKSINQSETIYSGISKMYYKVHRRKQTLFMTERLQLQRQRQQENLMVITTGISTTGISNTY